VGHPIDLVKVRQQTAAPAAVVSTPPATSATLIAPPRRIGTLGTLRNIAMYEGMAGLYVGVAAPLLAVVPAFALSFWSFDTARRLQLQYSGGNSKGELSLSQIAFAGGCSGLPLAAVVGPLDRIKCLMQVHPTKYQSFMDCLRAVYREGGLRSVFRGTGTTILRDVPGNAAYFATYEVTKRGLLSLTTSTGDQPQTSAVPVAVTLLAGGMAGVGNWIVAIPMDVVKSRWQTAQPGTYTSPGHVLRVLLQKEGPAALFRGLAPALLRAFPANAACLLGVETAQSVLKMWWDF
jgi:solute carrier family 25 carnitine/acylcarnitine transporter 20/29